MNRTPIDATPPLAAGSRIRDYEILGLLRQSPWYCSYRARRGKDEVLLREFLPVEFMLRSGGELRERDPANHSALRFWIRGVLDQASALEQLRHPALLRSLEHFQANETVYCATERPPGETLAERIVRDGPLTEALLLQMLGSLLSALEALHQAHLLHRDLRPENIVVGQDGRGLLLPGFGVVRAPIRMVTRLVTTTAAAPYAAPEELNPGGAHGPWTDVFAMAMVCCGALGIRTAEPGRLAPQASRPVSAALLQALEAALSPAPDQRPQSIAAWRSLLPPLSAVAAPGGNSAVARTHASAARWKWLAAPAALAVLGAGAGLWWHSSKSPAASPAAAAAPVPPPQAGVPAATPPAPADSAALDHRADAHSKPATVEASPPAAPIDNSSQTRALEAEIARLRAEKEALLRNEAAQKDSRAAVRKAPRAAEQAASPPQVSQTQAAPGDAPPTAPATPPPQPAPITAMAAPAPAPIAQTTPILDRSQPCARPEYPELSRRLGEEGTVGLRIQVGPDGQVLQALIKSSSGHDRLDQATAQALSRCRFIPGTRNGAPVADWTEMKYVWRIDSGG